MIVDFEQMMRSPIDVVDTVFPAMLDGNLEDINKRYRFPLTVSCVEDGQASTVTLHEDDVLTQLKEVRGELLALGAVTCSVNPQAQFIRNGAAHLLIQVEYYGRNRELLKSIVMSYLLCLEDDGWKICLISGEQDLL